MHEMLAAAHRNGMVLVAAAGNNGPQAPEAYPAAYPEVIAVTATDIDDKLFDGANQGRYVSVAAPGVDVLVAAPNGGYDFTTGTSVATAHVSGLAALLLERDPVLTPDAVRAILMRTARDLGPAGRDDQFGAGLVDAYEALLTLAPATAERTVTH
jgi:subtilisin family serine protease